MTQEEWTQYIKYKSSLYDTLLPNLKDYSLISEANWIIRARSTSCEDFGIKVRKGDICYIDYGQQFINEMGYQHFGIVMSVSCKKVLVVPITSNIYGYRSAYDPKDNPNGKRHLMRIGRIKGLNKLSVLFLNDIRFINSARIIRIQGHISHRSKLFQQIQKRILEHIHGEDDDE